METDHKVASKDFNPTAGENIENALSTEPGKNLQENATLCGDEQTSHKRTGNSFTSTVLNLNIAYNDTLLGIESTKQTLLVGWIAIFCLSFPLSH